ncbi:MAG: hypothetical protein LBF78_09035 [Treponema sp.]|jgi:hypothetical protein|nr:hypothetical protein [Treponema sp.]
MKNKLFALTALAIGFFTGCASTDVRWDSIKLSRPDTDSSIYRLQYYYKAGNNIQREIAGLMDDWFSDAADEEYGYYVIHFSYNYYMNVMGALAYTWDTVGLFFPALLGVPTDSRDYTLTASLYIFDSNGECARILQINDRFTQHTGLYYGYNPSKKAGTRYSRLTGELLEIANLQSRGINQELRAAGPVTPEKDSGARARIQEYFRQ